MISYINIEFLNLRLYLTLILIFQIRPVIFSILTYRFCLVEGTYSAVASFETEKDLQKFELQVKDGIYKYLLAHPCQIWKVHIPSFENKSTRPKMKLQQTLSQRLINAKLLLQPPQKDAFYGPEFVGVVLRNLTAGGLQKLERELVKRSRDKAKITIEVELGRMCVFRGQSFALAVCQSIEDAERLVGLVNLKRRGGWVVKANIHPKSTRLRHLSKTSKFSKIFLRRSFKSDEESAVYSGKTRTDEGMLFVFYY